jgi:hypothetical protein
MYAERDTAKSVACDAPWETSALMLLLPTTTPGKIKLDGPEPPGMASASDVPFASVVPSTIHLTHFVRTIPQVLGACKLVTPFGT